MDKGEEGCPGPTRGRHAPEPPSLGNPPSDYDHLNLNKTC